MSLLRYAVAGLSRSAFAAVALAEVAWFWLLDRWPGTMWLAAGIAAGLLGAGTSRLFDEPAAGLVDTLPRPLWWRTLARLVPAGVLAAGWLVGIAATDLGPTGQAGLLGLFGLGAIAATAAICTELRRRGRPAPGATVGSGTFLVLTYLALRNPLSSLLPLFPLVDDPEVAASRRIWTAVLLGSGAAMTASLVLESRRQRPR